MLKLRVLLAVFALIAFIPQAAFAALALAQTPATNTGTGTTPSAVFASAPPSTDLLVGELSTASESIVQSLPSGWTSIQNGAGTTGCWSTRSFYRLAPGGTTTFSLGAVLSLSGTWALTIYDISGQASGAAAINANGTNTHCNATGVLQPSATSTTTGILALTFGVSECSGLAVPSGYTSTYNLNPFGVSTCGSLTGNYLSASHLYATGGSGTITAVFGSSTNSRGQMIIVAPASTPKPGSCSLLLLNVC